MAENDTTFGANFGSIFLSGVRGYFANIVPLTLAGILTLGTSLAFRIPAQAAFVDEQLARSLALDMVGLLLAMGAYLPGYGAL